MNRTFKRNLIIVAFIALLSPNLYFIALDSFSGSIWQKIQFTLLATMLLVAPLLVLPLRLYIGILMPLGFLIPLAHLHLYFTGESITAASLVNIARMGDDVIMEFLGKNMDPIVIGSLITVIFWTSCFCIFHAPIDLKFSRRFKVVFFATVLFLQGSLWNSYQNTRTKKTTMRQELVKNVKKELKPSMPGLFPTSTCIEITKAVVMSSSSKRERIGH